MGLPEEWDDHLLDAFPPSPIWVKLGWASGLMNAFVAGDVSAETFETKWWFPRSNVCLLLITTIIFLVCVSNPITLSFTARQWSAAICEPAWFPETHKCLRQDNR